MKDFRKFCRPKTTKNPRVGDVEVRLNCGSTVYVKAKDYLNIKNFFKRSSVVGEAFNTSGNIKVYDKILNKEITITPEDYSNNLDRFELVEIIGEKKDPFGNYEYVDLGLPSGTLWCTTNVGANSEGTVGNYYKFGETTIYDGSDYNTSGYSEVYDPNIDLPSEYDAASANQGGGWHIPTKALWDELINNTTHTWISDYNGTGVDVVKFEKTNDSSIFIIIPAGGSYTDGVLKLPNVAYYWTKTIHMGSVHYAILTENSYFFTDWTTAFGHGHLVRAVCDSVDSQGLAQKGDIICHNASLDRDVIFSYSNWLTLDDSWDLVGLYDIETYDEEHALDGDYIIMFNGHTLIINPLDYPDVLDHWEHVDTIDKE